MDSIWSKCKTMDWKTEKIKFPQTLFSLSLDVCLINLKQIFILSRWKTGFIVKTPLPSYTVIFLAWPHRCFGIRTNSKLAHFLIDRLLINASIATINLLVNEGVVRGRAIYGWKCIYRAAWASIFTFSFGNLAGFCNLTVQERFARKNNSHVLDWNPSSDMEYKGCFLLSRFFHDRVRTEKFKSL